MADTDADLLAEGDLVADYLEELLDIADLDGDIENSVKEGRAYIAIDTESEQLVGKDGEVLDAIQELARLVVMTETGNRSRLMVDVAGFRARRARGAGQGRNCRGTGDRGAGAPDAHERLRAQDRP